MQLELHSVQLLASAAWVPLRHSLMVKLPEGHWARARDALLLEEEDLYLQLEQTLES